MSTATTTRRDAATLRALVDEGLRVLGDAPRTHGPEASAEQAIAWVVENFPLRGVAVASSMANGVLPHLVSQQLPGVDVLFGDTGYHFAETTFTRNEVAERLDVTVVDVRPELTVAEQNEKYGRDLFARDPNLCCAMRKVDPMHHALQEYEVWLTGVRRQESLLRSNTPLITWDERNGLVKVNPLAAWSFDELLDYAAAHDVPINPLVAQGYPSIGCAPCTQPIADGEDPRAGRWAGLAKTECGLHL
ncbi:phosphoadenylyl-sulfate reductase [Microbacterium horticulturae]|uniref:Adenosine 5'-phosphosulfate reductase n=1 Tax=Microbacterium horticulturae TaxID=3028316 RepID=A0ABY8BXI4_9MICO|nr:phosphoadenylyl-sulfate reductase [Microbacterium sp. KACC 23027]WEG08592.1 phosphoadenylyl-sulfate reductase [Microbacterium sp. KACC 23027]